MFSKQMKTINIFNDIVLKLIVTQIKKLSLMIALFIKSEQFYLALLT